jgi:uncharacterized protein
MTSLILPAHLAAAASPPADPEDDWTQTYTGKQFVFTRPEMHQYDVRDIAHHLSLICRYGGASQFHYSVAQHSFLMAMAAHEATGDPVAALDALFHDAPEAYLGDIKRPIKVQLPTFSAIEKRVDKAIRWQMRERGVPVPIKQTAIIREFDSRILVDERAQVMAPTPFSWSCDGLEPLAVTIEPMEPVQAERHWLSALAHFHSLATGGAQ